MAKYFKRFPLIEYDGKFAKNIMAAVDFTEEAKRDIYSFFNFTLEEGKSRPDVLSYNYYDSSQYDWLIYMANQVIDPYHDYYKEEEQMKEHIKDKYGSIAVAEARILFYRNNWYKDTSTITLAAYDNLTANTTVDLRKYWKPKLNSLGGIIGYERVQEDWIASTNKVVQVTLTSNVSFTIGDIVKQPSTNATGVVEYSNGNIVTVKHVTGTFSANTEENIANTNIIKENINTNEESYWEPVYAYDDEVEKNELRKNISLIKSNYVPQLDKMFKEKIGS